eukprot:CAMPEP_0197587524 /NCGR_PEP_ID=MMETSP1326-20131121/9128_1 /TAXON_ID=1155430 /ORGANISM="Genus nov. species nov., Strain RCC2288" /LENGTH=823 /DNA_ID=CAMNT_0043152265 /DNA_START=244 /DNA_END=2712 /DNA_ORIENTATION=+
MVAMRAPRSPEKAMRLFFALLLAFAALLIALSRSSTSELHLRNGHIEHSPHHSSPTGEHAHASASASATSPHNDNRGGRYAPGEWHREYQLQKHKNIRAAAAAAREYADGDEEKEDLGGGSPLITMKTIEQAGKTPKPTPKPTDAAKKRRDRRHDGGDDGDHDGNHDGGHDHDATDATAAHDDLEGSGVGFQPAAHPDGAAVESEPETEPETDTETDHADGHAHGMLQFDHNDEIHADPVGDWVHHVWDNTKHLAHDVYEVGHHAVDAVEEMVGYHHRGQEGEDSMSGDMGGGGGEGAEGGGEGGGEGQDFGEDEFDMSAKKVAHAHGNARAIMSSMTLAELVLEAGTNRKKAQSAVLFKLAGKVQVAAGKPTADPVPAYNYSSAPPPEPKQCKGNQGNPAKIARSSVVNQKYIFHNSGSYAYSHMVMIGAMPSTSLWRWAMTWQASASIEGAPGQHLLISFSDEPESSWTKPMMIPITPTGFAVWGPVWHLDANGVIWLFFSHSTSCLKNAGRGKRKYAPGGDIKYIKSVDGVSWTAPKTILTQAADQGIPKLVANQLQVHSGTGAWVLPYWREQPHCKQCRPHADRSVRTSAGVLVLTNQGATWRPIGSWRARGIRWLIEGTVAEVGDKGRLLQLYRSGEPTLYKHTSDDGGNTWTEAVKTSIPNPNSKVNLIRLDDGDIALAFNDARGGVRRKLSVAVSPDGSRWKQLQQLEDTTPGLHYSYPTMAQDGCRLLVAYSVMRHGGRQPISKSGIKLAVITIPTKKENGGGGKGGGGGGASGATGAVDGVDAGISLDAPAGGEDIDAKEAEINAEEEEKPIRG